MNNTLFADIHCAQRFCGDEEICGDTFLFNRLDRGQRSIVVLSDGMGHGVKANILSTITASMIVNFDYINDDIKTLAENIIKSLPVCSVRKMSYSTFSLIDINVDEMKATVIEYDNPRAIVLRDGIPLECEWQKTEFNNNLNSRRTIVSTTFSVLEGDRIAVMSDGVTQSGLGTKPFPFGWKRENVLKYIQSYLNIYPSCSSKYLCEKVVQKGVENDQYITKDDISCAMVTLRKSHNLLLCSCPPSTEAEYQTMVDTISAFDGRRVICGYHLARLISMLTGRDIVKGDYSPDPDVQPLWYMEGVDFITESLVTLNKVYDMLQNGVHDSPDGVGAAWDVYRLIIESDTVTLLLGTSRGNGGEYMVDEYELRRKAMGYIAQVLERKYMKEVNIIYY